MITGRIGMQYQRGLDSLYLIISTGPRKGLQQDGSCRLNGNVDLCNGWISRIWSHCNPWSLPSTQSRIISTGSQNLTGGSRMNCETGIESFQGCNGAVFM